MSYEPEAVIITIEYPAEKISVDMELPAVVPVGRMKLKILDIMKSMYPGIFSDWNDCIFINGNNFLSDRVTLNNAGIYDGSSIYISKI